MRSRGTNTYGTSTGERLKKSVIDQKIRKAKELKLEAMRDEYGYIFCEDCGRNANAGLPLDCSHDISVAKCQNEGKSELAYDINNITIRCRECHKKHDKIDLKFKKNV